MTTNEAIVKHIYISKIIFKDGNSELSKDLKIKIMDMRIKLSKVHKEFDSDCQEATKQLLPANYQELSTKPDKTPDETKQLSGIQAKYQQEYNAYVNNRLGESAEVNVGTTFTEDEYNQIFLVNSGRDEFDFNGKKLSAGDFFEEFYSVFVDGSAFGTVPTSISAPDSSLESATIVPDVSTIG